MVNRYVFKSWKIFWINPLTPFQSRDLYTLINPEMPSAILQEGLHNLYHDAEEH